MILVTGARGSVGRALVPRLLERTPLVQEVDIEEMDVTDRFQVEAVIRQAQPDYIFHLAGAKHAFEGERDPEGVTRVNVLGTRHVLDAAERVGAKVIFSSTCKACDPETAYGASKLLAERLVLNAGGVVVRYYNIPESSGNVFRLWESLDPSEPIPYTDCWRYFISMDDALALTMTAMEFESGRYIVDPGLPRHMGAVAREVYPDRRLTQIPRRRGDRFKEPLKAACEDIWHLGGAARFCAVVSPYDTKTRETYGSFAAVA